MGLKQDIKKAGTPSFSRVFRLKKSENKFADAYAIAYMNSELLTEDERRVRFFITFLAITFRRIILIRTFATYSSEIL